MTDTIRIGTVGAGANTRLRHIPGFQAIDGVQLHGVVNRSAESTARVAKEFGIPQQYDHWEQLVADPDIDAVMIGTWPNLHAEVTCAALRQGKHVLTEARMARTLEEAEAMWAASQAAPELIAQIVPSPFGLAEHRYLRQRIEEGFLGELRELVIIGANDQFYDDQQPLHWRQDREISGDNLLAMGILHEAAMRWTPPTTRVFAQTRLFAPTRPGPGGGTVEATIPDSAQIVTELAGGAVGIYHLSGCALFGPGLQIHLYGSRGTFKLHIAPEAQLWEGAAGGELRPAEIPNELLGGWRVEEEFIAAIRGEESVQFTTFAAGVDYMRFTDAVARSARSGQAVSL